MSEEIRKATHSGELKIGDPPIPCAVLEDGTRVLSHRGFMNALGRPRKGGRRPGGDPNLPEFISTRNVAQFIPDTMTAAMLQPIIYRPQHGGRTAYGVNATLLPQICEVWLKARDAGVLLPSQAHIPVQADILMRGLAHIGIIALVDAATGYQDVRAREALEKILEKFISLELLKWARMFPDEFYQQIFRLKNWPHFPHNVKRPSVVGHMTNDVVYARLAPGVLNELRRITPKDDKGRRKHKYFQRLTEDVGHPKLREHLIATIALMRASNNWDGFHRLLQRAYPKLNTNLEFPIDEDDMDKP